VETPVPPVGKERRHGHTIQFILKTLDNIGVFFLFSLSRIQVSHRKAEASFPMIY
jgi:hypothetical protein